MATLEDWNAYMGVLFDLAKIEDDLRKVVAQGGVRDYYQDVQLADRILFERFGVDL